jgi:hypothetical protein
MAMLPPDGDWLVQQIGREVVVFRRYTEEEIVRFPAHDGKLAAISQKIIHDCDQLDPEQKAMAWTAEEDTFLVERRADDVSIHLIANDLGRTPAACATRLSTLTGIPRNQIVEAYIEGTLDHEQDIHGLFTGKVRKVTP